MSRISEREVARKLSQREELEPPADLLARLKAEVPAEIRLAAPAAEAAPEGRPAGAAGRHGAAPPARRMWLLAASLLAVVGTGLFSLRVMERMPDEMASEVAEPSGAAEEARLGGAEMETQAAPDVAVDKQEQEGVAATAPRRLSGETRGRRDGSPAVDGSRAAPEDEGSPAEGSLASQGSPAAEPAPSPRPVKAPSPPPPPPSAPAPEVAGERDAGDATVEDSVQEGLTRLRSEPSAELERRKADLQARRPAMTQPAPLRKERGNEENEKKAVGKAGGVAGQAAQAAPQPEAAETMAEEISVVGGFAPRMAAPATGSSAAVDHATGGPGAEGANPFVDPEEDRISTFGLEVDTASYLVARRYLEDGRLPPPASVRVEEFVNFFHYGDPAPERGDFALAAEGAPTPFTTGERYRVLRFSVRARGNADAAGVPQPVARDARAHVVFDPRAVARYRLIGFENRDADERRYNRSLNDLGEIGAGHEVTVLYEVKLQPDARPSMPLATVRLRYRPLAGGDVQEVERSLRLGELAHTWEQASPSLRLAAVVAELAEILRGSYWAREGSLQAVLRQARNLSAESAGSPEAERTSELVDLVDRAAKLSAGRSAD